MTSLPLSHYSNTDTIDLRTIEQHPQEIKPRGLWVSVDGPDDWPAWCEAEQFRDTTQQHRFRITLAEHANVLHLSGMGELTDFTTRYEYSDHPSALAGWWIRWPDVARDWQGVIIAPYCWPARLELGWYYGWDCASGCIWDATAIDKITLIQRPQKEKSCT